MDKTGELEEGGETVQLVLALEGGVAHLGDPRVRCVLKGLGRGREEGEGEARGEAMVSLWNGWFQRPPHFPLPDPPFPPHLTSLAGVKVEGVCVAIYEDAPTHPHDEVGKEEIEGIVRLYEGEEREDLVARVSQPHGVNIARDYEGVRGGVETHCGVKSVGERVREELREWGRMAGRLVAT